MCTHFTVKSCTKRCTERSIANACLRRGDEAGVKASIHCIRRTVSSELQKVCSRAMVANLLGHSEEVNRDFYTYDTSTESEQKLAFSSLFSNVLNFEDFYSNKKTTETLAK